MLYARLSLHTATCGRHTPNELKAELQNKPMVKLEFRNDAKPAIQVSRPEFNLKSRFGIMAIERFGR